MSQATLPASAMIFLKGGSAMKPCLASSKSRLSSNGSVAWRPLRTSSVNVDGSLPFGWKCSGAAVAGCAAAPASAAEASSPKPPESATTRARLDILILIRSSFPAGEVPGRDDRNVDDLIDRSLFVSDLPMCLMH